MPMSVHNYPVLIAGNYNAHDIDDRIARSAWRYSHRRIVYVILSYKFGKQSISKWSYRFLRFNIE